jgi:hypothetical protein
MMFDGSLRALLEAIFQVQFSTGLVLCGPALCSWDDMLWPFQETFLWCCLTFSTPPWVLVSSSLSRQRPDRWKEPPWQGEWPYGWWC